MILGLRINLLAAFTLLAKSLAPVRHIVFKLLLYNAPMALRALEHCTKVRQNTWRKEHCNEKHH